MAGNVVEADEVADSDGANLLVVGEADGARDELHPAISSAPATAAEDVARQ